MGKNDDDLIRRAAANAFKGNPQQPQLQVATPQTWEQLVAWVAALVYPHVHVTGNMLETRTGLAVKASVDIIAKSAAAVSAGVLRDAAKAEVARLEQEQADQGNPSTAQN